MRKTLSVFSLVMITVVSVDSVRNLPATALFGSSLVVFFLIAGFTFLIPSALVSAELSARMPDRQGVYDWVKEAFGPRYGLLAIWFQWIENVIWYPTILSFIAGTLAYAINPALANDRWYLVMIIMLVFWSVSLLNMRGIHASVKFSHFCAIAGLMMPMLVIIGLGVLWLVLGKPIQVSLQPQALMPNLTDPDLLVSMTAVILCCSGIEVATVHAKDVRNPQRDYPRALLIAVAFILVTLILGSLAIAMVVPRESISLVSGLMEAFNAFFAAFGLAWLTPIMAVFVLFGVLGGLNNWILAPSKGLAVGLNDLDIDSSFQRNNRYGAPSAMLLLQAVIVSLMSLLFLYMPSINSSYWLLTVLASQLYMFMYILMFAAGVALRYRKGLSSAAFRVPGPGNFGMWLVASVGIMACLFTIFIGFHPPADMQIHNVVAYKLMVAVGLVVFSAPPFFILRWVQRRDLAVAVS